MRIDFDTRLSALFLIGAGGFLGELVISIIGLPTNGAIIGGSVTLLLGSVGIGIAAGAANRAGERREADEETGA